MQRDGQVLDFEGSDNVIHSLLREKDDFVIDQETEAYLQQELVGNILSRGDTGSHRSKRLLQGVVPNFDISRKKQQVESEPSQAVSIQQTYPIHPQNDSFATPTNWIETK